MLRTIKRSIERKEKKVMDKELKRKTHVNAGIAPRKQRRLDANKLGNVFQPQYDVTTPEVNV